MANISLSDIIQGGKAYMANNVLKVSKKEVFNLGKCEATFDKLFKAYLITDALGRDNTYTVQQKECLQSELLNQINSPENSQGVDMAVQNIFSPFPGGGAAGGPHEFPPTGPGGIGPIIDITELEPITNPSADIMACEVAMTLHRCADKQSSGVANYSIYVSGGIPPYTYSWVCKTASSFPASEQGDCSDLTLYNTNASVLQISGIQYEKAYGFEVTVTDAAHKNPSICTKFMEYSDKLCNQGVYG